MNNDVWAAVIVDGQCPYEVGVILLTSQLRTLGLKEVRKLPIITQLVVEVSSCPRS
jgi:hypothetical protein